MQQMRGTNAAERTLRRDFTCGEGTRANTGQGCFVGCNPTLLETKSSASCTKTTRLNTAQRQCITFEFTGAARLHRAASGGMMGSACCHRRHSFRLLDILSFMRCPQWISFKKRSVSTGLVPIRDEHWAVGFIPPKINHGR